MPDKDDSFPRGGFKPTFTADKSIKKPQKQENLFGNVQLAKKTKTKKKREKLHDTEATSLPEFVSKSDKSTAISADTLSYVKIHEGMTVLACVKQLNVMTVDVELPGRCFAEILVQNISPAYTKLVSHAVKDDGMDLPTLEDVLKVGTFIPVKIVDIADGGDKLRVFASCNPADINSNLRHANITKNMLVWGAVKEKSDHGYLIDLGIKNCRAHLPFISVEEGVEYNTGQVLYMTVSFSTNSKEANVATLSAIRAHFDETIESMGTSIDHVIPGVQVEFLIQKILKDGIQGQYFDECTGLINELYLKKPFDVLKKYKEFREIKARLLYVHPVSKLGYFTLRNLDDPLPEGESKLQVGCRKAGTVVSKAGAGLIVKLDGGSKGFITYKRLLKTINDKEKDNVDLATLIANKFPAGTTKHCTILDYNHTEMLYMCTFEDIKDTISIHQLEVGQLVKGTVKSVNNHGLVIRIGKVEGFAPNDNLSNVQYSENIKKQFKVGQEVTVKIWNINIPKKDIVLTLKPELLSNNTHLTSYDSLDRSEQYPGVVISAIPAGILLLFYNGIKGFLPVRNIPQLGNKDARKEFYKGQVVKARMDSYKDGRLTLTLNLSQRKRIPVGTIISKPSVTKVSEEGLHVKVDTVEAFVPRQQLAVHGLGKLLTATYKVNDVLEEELICLLDSNPPILSVTEYVAHKRDDLQIPNMTDIKVDVVLRGMKNTKNSLILPVKLHNKPFRVEDKRLATVERYESVVVKVEKCLGKGKFMLNARLYKVFSFNFLETLQYLDQYLQDIERLRNRYLHTSNSLVDLEIGSTVDCIVNKIDLQRGCSVFVLPMHCQGLASLAHFSESSKPGEAMKGKILWVNYELKYAAVTLKQGVMAKINDKQDREIDMSKLHANSDTVKVEILLANKHAAVGVLNENFNKQLVYMPVKLHENDFSQTNYYDSLIGKMVRSRLMKMKSGRLLAIPLGLIAQMKAKAKNSGRIIKLRTRDKVLKKAEKKTAKKLKNEEDKTKFAESEEIKDEDEGIESSDEIKSEPDSEHNEEQETPTRTKKKRKLSQSAEVIEIKEITEEPKKKKNTKAEEETKLEVVLPGMSSFFEEDTEIQPKEDSDNDEEVTSIKKKFTPAERLQAAKDEEARLRKIESELADASVWPQNAEQFDRALLGNPDDSELWTRYIAFHAQSTEFDKARSVARRAIERISFSALQDRLNVWLALLNVENMYGTKDSFDKVFVEAARCNDTMTIFLETIKMQAEMSKFSEMEEKVKKAKGKFKQELQMWLEIGKVYYKCGRFADARKLKDNALMTLTDKKSHLLLIVQFAIMEFSFGETAQGEALFETILQADPKRVDVWCTYVDQLIKKDKVDLARNVLQRAIGQKLPYKKMRTLFKKYHTFETAYGTEETVEHVTKLLREYGDQ